MTTFATESLQKLADLSIYINQYPIPYRKDLIVRQITQLEELEEKAQRSPQLELRWLQYNQRKLKKVDSALSVEFGKIVDNCKKHVKNISTTKSYNENELTDLIKKQKELIFNQCLSNATKDYLEEYKDNLNKPFSAEEIFKKAINKYQKLMYQESLYQFETNSLIYNKKNLENQKIIYKKNIFLIELIEKELKFVNSSLNNNNLIDLKFNGTKSISEELLKLTEFSEENIKNKLNKFFKKNAHKTIEMRVTKESFIYKSLDAIESRNFYKYFSSKDAGNITCVQHLIETHKELNIQEITIPNYQIVLALQPKDEELKVLREIVLSYKKVLKNITADENKNYTNREKEALDMRDAAINSLKMTLDRVDTLNDETKNIAKQLVREIKNHKPTWAERSLLDKILDICSLGTRSIYRYFTFRETKEETDLYNILQDDSKTNKSPK